MNWDWKTAYETIIKGLELFPNYASLHHAFSNMFWLTGDQPNCLKILKKGLQLDPLSVELKLYVGVAYLLGKEYKKANSYFDKILEMVPNHRVSYEYKGWVEGLQDNHEEALAIFEKLEPFGYRLHRSTCLGWVYFKLGHKDKAEACLQELLNLESQSLQGIGFTVDLATLYTGFGNFDKAFDYLEKAIENRVGSIMFVKSYPMFEPLFDKPRFQKIEEMIGEVPEIDF